MRLPGFKKKNDEINQTAEAIRKRRADRQAALQRVRQEVKEVTSSWLSNGHQLTEGESS